ncbi:glycosyltransferase [Variovorax guangxiensis]|uniref:Glycosyltransferase n=1 Tax=Variovorax guangxiensis TaxID=1775474 RepID=A0A502DNL6_9BURK|nr:glycosyltransferase [Variovorax guangxiensis]TPG20632.1 glycosyltransferase [Variovorax ginsengisoli]TPG25781.1 glycosyltransferase [Variovorax guangxiensis]
MIEGEGIPSVIAIFLPSLNGGGAERVMVTIANAFAARGFQVDLVLASAQGPYLKDVSSAVRVVNLKAKRVSKALWPLTMYLRRERPRTLLSALSHANVIALLAKKLAGVPLRLVVSERGFTSGEFSIAKGVASRINYRLVRWLYPRADGICTVSQVAAKDLADFVRLPSSRVQNIYNPFDISRIDRLCKEPLTHPWFESGQPPVLLAIGRMNEAKDFPVLLRAFAQLHRHRAVRLVILGEGELRPELEALLLQLSLDADVVQLPGFVSNPFVWLAHCSLFVLSSRREGLPGALIEAMACGTPVVSTNCLSGPDEILEGGRWGRLVPVGDADALASAMAATLDTPKNRLPDVRRRAADFEQGRAVDAYLRILGMPLQRGSKASPFAEDEPAK